MRRIKIENDKSPDIDRNITFGEFADIWYNDIKGQVEESTYRSYHYTLKKLKESLGNICLYELKPIHINRFYQSILNVYSNSYIIKTRTMLIQICDYAEDNGMTIRNAARHSMKLKKLSGNNKKGKRRFYGTGN